MVSYSSSRRNEFNATIWNEYFEIRFSNCLPVVMIYTQTCCFRTLISHNNVLGDSETSRSWGEIISKKVPNHSASRNGKNIKPVCFWKTKSPLANTQMNDRWSSLHLRHTMILRKLHWQSARRLKDRIKRGTTNISRNDVWKFEKCSLYYSFKHIWRNTKKHESITCVGYCTYT